MDRFLPNRSYDASPDSRNLSLSSPDFNSPGRSLPRAASSFGAWAHAAHSPARGARAQVDAQSRSVSSPVHASILQRELGMFVNNTVDTRDDSRPSGYLSNEDRLPRPGSVPGDHAPSPSTHAALTFARDADAAPAASKEPAVSQSYTSSAPGNGLHSPGRLLYFGNENFGPASRGALLVPGDNLARLTPLSAALLDSASTRPRASRTARAPYRVLDAPDLADDFYLSLLDWSAQNVIITALVSDVYLWNGYTTKVDKLMSLEDDSRATAVAWSCRGGHAAVGTSTGQLQVWDAVAGKLVRTMGGHEQRLGAISWAGPMVASSGKDKSILIRDLRTPDDYCAHLKGHTHEVCGLKWSLDWTMLASGANDNKLYIWSAAKMGGSGRSPSAAAQLFRCNGHTAAVKGLAWSPHQPGLLASGGGTQDKSIKFWNANTGMQVGSVDTGSQVCQLAWCSNSRQLISAHGYSTNSVAIWHWPSMEQVATMTGHNSRVLYMSMSPDGTCICTGAGDGSLRFWQVDNGSPLPEVPVADVSRAAMRSLLSHDGEPSSRATTGFTNLQGNMDVR